MLVLRYSSIQRLLVWTENVHHSKSKDMFKTVIVSCLVFKNVLYKSNDLQTVYIHFILRAWCVFWYMLQFGYPWKTFIWTLDGHLHNNSLFTGTGTKTSWSMVGDSKAPQPVIIHVNGKPTVETYTEQCEFY